MSGSGRGHIMTIDKKVHAAVEDHYACDEHPPDAVYTASTCIVVTATVAASVEVAVVLYSSQLHTIAIMILVIMFYLCKTHV